MPQVSKNIPIKGFKNQPAVFKSREYSTSLGKMYMVERHLNLVASDDASYYFYHATKSYELSFEILSSGYCSIFFEECDVLTTSGVLDVVECTNRHRPGSFDLEFGWTDDWGTNLVSFIDTKIVPGELLYCFGRDELTFVCKPDKYYVFTIDNIEAATEAQGLIFYIGEI